MFLNSLDPYLQHKMPQFGQIVLKKFARYWQISNLLELFDWSSKAAYWFFGNFDWAVWVDSKCDSRAIGNVMKKLFGAVILNYGTYKDPPLQQLDYVHEEDTWSANSGKC